MTASVELHIAIGSTTSKPGRLEENLAQIRDFACRAADDGADILLTPEMSATGYGAYPEVLALAESAGQGPIFARLAGLARETGVAVCAGFVEAAARHVHLAHYIVRADGSFLVQRKHRVTPAEHPLEPASPLLPVAGDEFGQPRNPTLHIFRIRDVRCALVICADAGIARLNELLAARGVDVLLLPTGAGGKREDRVSNAELRAAGGITKYGRLLQTVFYPGSGITDCLTYGRALAAVNMCGYDGRDYYHAGHGMIINPMGEVQAFIHGLPNLDRQHPSYAHAIVTVRDRLWAPEDTTRGLPQD